MEQLQRKANRLPEYDYSQNGAYFVTICTKDKALLLWDNASCVGATCGRPENAPPLSALGCIVDEEIAVLHQTYRSLKIDKHVVMPNHVHLLISITSEQKEDGRTQFAPTLSRAIKQFKGAVTKRCGAAIWQKSFHDHVVRNAADYLRIWQYIDGNPSKWQQDCYYHT